MRSAFRTRLHRPKVVVELPPLGSTVTDNSTATDVILIIEHDAYAAPVATDDTQSVALATAATPGGFNESVDETPVTTTDTVTVVLI